jgi:DNA-binding CsgD family transcriptional regulator
MLLHKLASAGLIDTLSRGILSVVQAAMSSTAAFCVILGDELVECATTGWLSIDGIVEPVGDRHISALLPEALHDGVHASRIELLDGHDQLLVVSFDVESMRVCAGVVRPRAVAPFDPTELGRLHDLVPVALQLAALHARCLEYARNELVLRSLRSVTDACCVLDLDTRRVRWVHELDRDQPCARYIFHDEENFINLVERLHGASSDDEQSPGSAVIGRLRVVRTVDLGRPEEFDASRSLAVALTYTDGESTKLSTRERQIAQLLATGYSTVNAAAILSLSENTIRTYVRRLYRKLEITNRADLTRKCAELYLC